MRSSIKISVVLVTLLLSCACSNEIDLFPDTSPSSYMVYAILDCTGHDQYVKIRKTFGGEQDYRLLAQNPDLFLPDENLMVSIQEWHNGYCAIYPCAPSVHPKDTGLFSSESNVLYETSFFPEVKMEYKLLIEIPETGEQLTAKTSALMPARIVVPSSSHMQVTMSDSLNPFLVRYSATGLVHILQLYLNYIEVSSLGDTSYFTKRFDCQPKYMDPSLPVVAYEKTWAPDYLLRLINSLVDKEYSVAFRQLHSFDFKLWAGDQVLKEYLMLGEEFPDNRKQFFSNINNGFGLFASVSSTAVDGIIPRSKFLKSLQESDITSKLRFSRYLYKGPFNRGVTAPGFPADLIREVHE